ncbi:MAG: cytochrome P450 [Alphaproteobacteria bacterium]|nr:cytochrome P450 [Alphaproteobacteria bacterium]
MTVSYDPRRPEIIADPYPIFARLRSEDPVHRSDVLGGWVLTRYDDVKKSLNDKRLSADRITPFLHHMTTSGRPVPTLARIVGNWAVFTDPPRHTRLRGLMNKAFTPRAVARLTPRIIAIVDRLITAMAGNTEANLIADFAYPLPVTVIADMIGVPSDDQHLFKTWSDELATFVGSNLLSPDKHARAEAAAGAMADYFHDIIAERRRAPRDDILSALIAAEDRGDVLGEDELIACCVLLLFAGHETTTNLIANGLYAMLRHGESLAVLRQSPEPLDGAVEEALRYDGPTQAMVRIALEDLEIGERRIAAGDRLYLMINAANRDDTVFTDPDRFDVRRESANHIAFGYGIHFCLGAPLARLEGRYALHALARRLEQVALGDRSPEWIDSLVFRGMRSLPITFREVI